MKINAKKLKKFIDKASLNGSIDSVMLSFNKEGLEAATRETSGSAMTIVTLNTELFKDYEAIGDIWIKNTLLFSKTLNSFDNEITIKKSDNFTFKLSDNKKSAELILGSKDAFDNNLSDEEVKRYVSLSLSGSTFFVKDQISGVIKDGENIKSQKFLFEQNGKILKVTIGEKGVSDLFIHNIENENGKGTSRVILGDLFVKLFNTLNTDSEVLIETGVDLPVRVTEKTEDITFISVIAPRIESE